MSVIDKAVHSVVSAQGQSELLAQAILAWFAELANGNESLEDMEVVSRRLELLMEKCTVLVMEDFELDE